MAGLASSGVQVTFLQHIEKKTSLYQIFSSIRFTLFLLQVNDNAVVLIRTA